MIRKKTRVSDIKREQKKSFLLKEISALFCRIASDEPKLSSLFITKVDLSRDSGICYIYFSTINSSDEVRSSKDVFYEGLDILKLYKPSMRKALAQAMKSRYVPNLVFRYDEAKEKERRVTSLLDKIQDTISDKDEE